ncbi:Sema and PSI domain containing protein [Trichuris trichiura]|uniref:Sema and PSI domain containing protein n=1 Tax=Trichuris trichiura TaxID=36087 RepID=A0A077Z296_TRITR|nr:Sema and PSI domain containing protein [Trichuris trichiura]
MAEISAWTWDRHQLELLLADTWFSFSVLNHNLGQSHGNCSDSRQAMCDPTSRSQGCIQQAFTLVPIAEEISNLAKSVFTLLETENRVNLLNCSQGKETNLEAVTVNDFSNVLYNISAEDFSVKQIVKWMPTKADIEDCLMKGKQEADCQNYIRLYAKSIDGSSLICGTNAFKPLCRLYRFENGKDKVLKEYFAAGILPYDSHQNSSFFYSAETHELFSATTADFGGSDPLIYKTDLTKTDTMGLRTDRYNKNLLNEPNFVTSFAIDDFVYFWFREVSYEKPGSGKTMYARVARVCRNDRGTKKRDNWTSFVKARLNCSSPGEFPHYFDELVSTSEAVPLDSSLLQSKLIYGVFNSPSSILPSSAICAFRMDDIERTFALSDFKLLPTQTSGRMRARFFGSLSARPRTIVDCGDPLEAPECVESVRDIVIQRLECVNDSRLLNEDMVSLMTSHPLVKDAVPGASKSPLLVMLGNSGRFTQIAIDPHVTAADRREYDVMFIGTDNGKVLKVINIPINRGETKPILIELVNVFAANSSITGLYVQHFEASEGKMQSQPTSAKLVVMSNNEIRLLPLFHCSVVSDCWSCLNLQDPYCAWHVKKKICFGQDSWKLSQHDSAENKMILQAKKDCPTGRLRGTPGVDTYKLSQKDLMRSGSPEDGMSSLNNDEAEAVKQDSRPEYFAIGIPITFVIASVIGFIVGYGCHLGKNTRKKNLPENKTTTKPGQQSVLALGPYNTTGKKRVVMKNCHYVMPTVVGMYDTVPRLSQTMIRRSELMANGIRPLTGCNTLPKPQLVKKVYV